MDKYFIAKKIAQELDKAQSEYYLLKKTIDSDKTHEKAFLEHIYKLSQLLSCFNDLENTGDYKYFVDFEKFTHYYYWELIYEKANLDKITTLAFYYSKLAEVIANTFLEIVEKEKDEF